MKPITLQFICTEDWDAMAHAQNGKHCGKCNKTVVDFTGKTLAEIGEMQHKANNTLCGRYKAEQTIYPKLAASLLITAGIALSPNIAKAQTPTKEKCTALSPLNKAIQSQLKQLGYRDYSHYVGGPFEVLPEYRDGGEQGMMKFLRENIRLSVDTTFKSKVTCHVQYVVTPAGDVENIKVLRGATPLLDAEVSRVVALLKFKPFSAYSNKKGITMVVPVILNAD